MSRRLRRLAGALAAAILVSSGCSSDSFDESADDTRPGIASSTSGSTPIDDATGPSVQGGRALEPAPGSWLVGISRSIDADAGVVVDAYQPLDGTQWPVVLVFVDDEVARARYETLATDVAEIGAVVFVASPGTAEPPTATSCAVAAAIEHAAAYGGDVTQLTVVGFGSGASLAVGEAFGEAWVDAQPTDMCAAQTGRYEPLDLIVIGGELDTMGVPGDRASSGLTPFDLMGTNPYIRIDLVDGYGGSEELVDDYYNALVGDGYDATLTTFDVSNEDLIALELGPELLEDLVAIITHSASSGEARQ